ncbi:MAG: Ger(x)C family spore germination C-terminal domain-containing protein, partial [Tumebacillaceae bacterium]
VYDSGKDAMLPYLRLGKEDVILDGLAVFDDDKMVGRVNAEEARLLAYLMGRMSVGELDAELPEPTSHAEHARVLLMYLKLKHKIDVSQVGNRPKFQIHLEVKGAVSEYTGAADLENPDSIKKLEKQLEAKLQKDATAVLHKLQKEFHSDPMGFGEMYRAHGYVEELTKTKWRKYYQQADIGVDVKIRIMQTGMIH